MGWALEAALPHDTIQLGPGTYEPGRAIIASKPVVIRGAGKGKTTIRVHTTSCCLRDYGISVAGNGVTLRDFTMVREAPTTPPPPLPRARCSPRPATLSLLPAARGACLPGCQVGNAAKSSMFPIHAENVDDLTLTDVAVDGGKRTGIDMYGVHNLRMTRVRPRKAAAVVLLRRAVCAASPPAPCPRFAARGVCVCVCARGELRRRRHAWRAGAYSHPHERGAASRTEPPGVVNKRQGHGVLRVGHLPVERVQRNPHGLRHVQQRHGRRRHLPGAAQVRLSNCPHRRPPPKTGRAPCSAGMRRSRQQPSAPRFAASHLSQPANKSRLCPGPHRVLCWQPRVVLQGMPRLGGPRWA